MDRFIGHTPRLPVKKTTTRLGLAREPKQGSRVVSLTLTRGATQDVPFTQGARMADQNRTGRRTCSLS